MPPEQLKALAMVDRVEQDRYNEILNLVKSVNDLSLLFKQLNTLVIEQVIHICCALQRNYKFHPASCDQNVNRIEQS